MDQFLWSSRKTQEIIYLEANLLEEADKGLIWGDDSNGSIIFT